MVFKTKNVKQIKRKSNWWIYLKPLDYLVILLVCECWGNSMKKEIFANKIKQFLVNMQKNTRC